jgi:integrase
MEIHKNHLCLRGILPPKPDCDRELDYRQRIYLGYPFLLEGIKQAEKDAKSIRVAIVEGRFDWHDWSKTLKLERAKPALDMSCVAVASRLEKDYFTRRARNPKSQTTWDSEYNAVYRRLPQEQELSEAVIMAAIAITTPETRTRRRYVQALNILAKFTGIEVDIKDYGKGYTPAKLEIRDLPSDEDIEMYHNLIPVKAWQNAYALIAIYGIRPHELVHLDLSDLPVLHVLENTKTGCRSIRGLHPKWIQEFGIKADMELPKITAQKNQEIGSRVGHQFTRYGIPFPAYNLRHAYAVRCSIIYQMPVAITAKMMGHSAAIHQATYLRHMKETTIDEIFEKKVAEFTSV